MVTSFFNTAAQGGGAAGIWSAAMYAALQIVAAREARASNLSGPRTRVDGGSIGLPDRLETRRGDFSVVYPTS